MKLNNRYEYNPATDLLGKGGFARVYKAQDLLLNRTVALKVFTGMGQYSVLEEIKKAIQLDHPNLLRFYDVLLLEQTNAVGEAEQTQVGVMELANAGDLKDFARANPGSPLLYKLLKEVLMGLEYLHSKGIIHRDLKAQNILLVKQDGQLTAKISDFGISKDTASGGQSSSMMVGTIEYMAPEQFSPAKYGIDGKIGSNLDLWSFGIMVHELLTDTTPFGSRDGETTAEQIMSQILSTEQPEGIDRLPEPYKSVVKKCLVANAKERIRKASELLLLFDVDAERESQSSDAKTKTASKARPADEITKLYPKAESTRPQQMATADTSTKVYPRAADTADDNKTEHEPPRLIQTPRRRNVWLIAGAILISFVGLWLGNYVVTNNDQATLKTHIAAADSAFESKDYNKAFALYSELRQKNDGYVSAQLGKLYENGLGVQIDFRLAKTWYLKASETGNGQAMVRLGSLYERDPDERDLKKAMLWYLKAVDQNIAEASVLIGGLYKKGLGVEKDYKKAMTWFLKSAELKFPAAIYEIGELYTDGFGVEKDYKQAMTWYLKAAELSEPRAVYQIGFLFENGFGVEQDYKLALSWYKKLSTSKLLLGVVSLADRKIGLFYRDGLGVKQDYKQAMSHFIKATQIWPDGDSDYEIGRLHQQGLGVEKDYAQAMTWYLRATKQEHPEASHEIGWFHQKGLGVTQDYKQAMSWYLKAAELKVASSMFQIGYLHWNGLGVNKNHAKAREWFLKVLETDGADEKTKKAAYAALQVKI
jgi:TPR repeat protein